MTGIEIMNAVVTMRSFVEDFVSAICKAAFELCWIQQARRGKDAKTAEFHGCVKSTCCGPGNLNTGRTVTADMK